MQRFADIPGEPIRMLGPIQGYEKMPLVSLEHAVEPLESYVPDVKRMVWMVKQNCDSPADGLTVDQSASIMLYTLEWTPRERSFYFAFNGVLRSEDRNKLKPWFLYLKLLIISLSKLPSSLRTVYRVILHILANARWTPNGVTVAGGRGAGNTTDRLSKPYSLFVTNDQTVVIADTDNHRIVQWKINDTNGQVVAGGHGKGNGLNQLNCPTDVLVDKETDSLIICDRWNRRVMRWSRQRGTSQGEILVDNILCWGLAIDNQRYLYVSDNEKHEVRRFQIGNKNETIVAGGYGKGSAVNQLSEPRYIFVDQQQAVYVSDKNNHRVVKWNKGAEEGIIVAGGKGNGEALTQLSHPSGLFVDNLCTVYVAEQWNHRVMRWTEGAAQGTVIAGGKGEGQKENQFYTPMGLCLDRHGHLYVADCDNHRVQRFSIEQTH
ncbi:unnamed protein product [Rotaria sp. Silwood2]|nr:unnamed protein product [Rotaria sp. Silwood2]CAF4218695.1 unnamed protein product [Rotaria sp. Silwood2]